MPSPSTTHASAGTGTFSPTASIKPPRTITVPLAITGPLTVTILALRIATVEGTSAMADAHNTRNALNSSFFIRQSRYYIASGGERDGQTVGLSLRRLAPHR